MKLSEMTPKSDTTLLPLARRVVLVFPTKRHVKAVQALLGDKLNQGEPIPYQEYIASPGAYKDDLRDIWIKHDTWLGLEKIIGSHSMFLAKAILVMHDGKLIDLRDQTSMTWGDREKRTLSSEIFAKFHEVYNRTPE